MKSHPSQEPPPAPGLPTPPAPAQRTGLAISGMTCGNCARHVTEAVLKVAGVKNVDVSLEEKEAAIRWHDGQPVDVPAVIRAVQEAGYEARPLDPAHHHSAHGPDHRASQWSSNLLLGAVLTAALMAGEWILQLGGKSWYRWLSLVLAAIVQFGPGRDFYRGAWAQLKRGRSNMDTLVALGSTTAFVYSAWALISGVAGHLYFMEAAAIITLISAGHWLEARVGAKAASSLRQLLNLAPSVARRLQPDDREVEVPAAQLQVGDLIALRPGERVPTDGTIVEGSSTVDESMLTGESLPVEKTGASQVYAGTTNLSGRLLVRVSSVGEETALAHVIAAVQRAQNSRANIQRLADQVSNVFVPAVVLIALATAFWWGFMPDSAHALSQWLGQYLWASHPPSSSLAAAVITAAAVLIVACPCAMGLATPAAIMAGANAASQRGILIRDGVALEKAGQISAVLFDKTGTLTSGRPEVIRREKLAEASGLTLDDGIQLAVDLARHSNHPLSQAVSRLGPPREILADWKEQPGAGVQARHPHYGLVRLGSLAWLQANGVDLHPHRHLLEQWSAEGVSILGLAAEQSLWLLLALADTLKPGAPAVIRQMERQHLKVYLVTGDNPDAAAVVASQLGIPKERLFAQVRPEQKAALVKQLQERGERIAFVGDGINDAPALEQSDLGIAVSRASDIAREAADIILLRSDIEAVPESIALARATLRTIKQNLFWAFFYNAAAIPLAALGFMSPVLCAGAMALSDLVVIGNALRLRGWKGESKRARA